MKDMKKLEVKKSIEENKEIKNENKHKIKSEVKKATDLFLKNYRNLLERLK